MHNNPALEAWAQASIHARIESAAQALAAYCRKPRSAKRLHAARKELARLRAVLEDLGDLAGVAPGFHERVHALHRRAGKLRDADVLLQRVQDYRERAFGGEADELKRLSRRLRKARRNQRVKIEREIGSLAPELRA